MSESSENPGIELFLASSVHDMKNSIGMLIGGLEKTMSQLDPATFAGYQDIAHMIYESKRINSNLLQLLTLYKAGHGLYPFDPQSLDVSGFLAVFAEQNERLLASQGIALEVAADTDLYWEFDEDLVCGVIGNALNNAIRYTGGRVRLVAAVVDGCLELRVEDDGKGYPPSMLAAGADAMRGVRFPDGSTGLGLYFSVVVARMHRNRGRSGEIRLENGGAWGGGCFVLRLP